MRLWNLKILRHHTRPFRCHETWCRIRVCKYILSCSKLPTRLTLFTGLLETYNRTAKLDVSVLTLNGMTYLGPTCYDISVAVTLWRCGFSLAQEATVAVVIWLKKTHAQTQSYIDGIYAYTVRCAHISYFSFISNWYDVSLPKASDWSQHIHLDEQPTAFHWLHVTISQVTQCRRCFGFCPLFCMSFVASFHCVLISGVIVLMEGSLDSH